jgi:hypothetical protein
VTRPPAKPDYSEIARTLTQESYIASSAAHPFDFAQDRRHHAPSLGVFDKGWGDTFLDPRQKGCAPLDSSFTPLMLNRTASFSAQDRRYRATPPGSLYAASPHPGPLPEGEGTRGAA